MGYGFYLYGIFPTPGPDQLDLQGLDQKNVETHRIEDFVFLYSEAQQERYLASRRNLLEHEKVLEKAMEAGYRTLLPLQFGLTVEDWSTVTQQLITPHSQGLLKLFSRLEGHREVGVKIFWNSEAELNRLMTENEDLRAERDRLEGKPLNMEEVVGIGQAIEQGLEAQKWAIIETFQTTLNPLAIEIVENDPLTSAMIYNAAYLIPWDAESEFSDRVESLDQQFEDRLKIRYNNFTAPYNFAQLDRL